MIRMFLFGAGFLAITIALIAFQPGSARKANDSVSEEVQVTRADPAFDLAEDSTAPVAAPTAPAPTPVVRYAAPDAPLDDAGLRRMTWETLSNLNTATGRDNAPGQPGSLLHTIVKRSLNEGPRPVVNDFGSYIVQPGDSLVSIAEQIYGDVNMTGPLFAANADLLRRPDDLRAGQRLSLPEQ